MILITGSLLGIVNGILPIPSWQAKINTAVLLFQTAVQGFRPAPFVALRTLKAETIAGVSEGAYRHLLAQFKTSNEWMVSGTHAVIQFHE